MLLPFLGLCLRWLLCFVVVGDVDLILLGWVIRTRACGCLNIIVLFYFVVFVWMFVRLLSLLFLCCLRVLFWVA